RRGTRCDNPTLVTIAEVGHLVLLWRPEPAALMPADLKRLHKYMLDVEHIGIISDEMREVVEELWPELAHKLTPKRPQGQPQACRIVRNCCSAPRGHDIRGVELVEHPERRMIATDTLVVQNNHRRVICFVCISHQQIG